MDFNFTRSLLLISGLSLLAACGITTPDAEDQHTIGDKLQTMSALTAKDGTTKQKVTIFDKTTRKIRRFDLATMKHEKSFDVGHPELDHTLLYDESHGYGVDLTNQQLATFDNSGTMVAHPMQFQGKPSSAAFSPETKTLVVYDDMRSVEILHIEDQGRVVQSWVGGPLLSSGATVAAGDLNSSGSLILGLSDGSIATVDVASTLEQQKWVFTRFATTLNYISWLAPVPANPDYILVRASGTLALVQLSTQTIVDQYSFGSLEVLRMSRQQDPHVLIRDYSQIRMVYVKFPSTDLTGVPHIQANSVYFDTDNISNSQLNVKNDTWSFISSNAKYDLFKGRADQETGRTLKMFRVSDLLALKTKALPDKAQLQATATSVFALFPAALGYAVNYNLFDDGQTEARMFNLPDIK